MSSWQRRSSRSGHRALVILTAVGVLMVSLVSLAVRFRHARGTVRQQLKWLVYAMSLAVVAQLVPPLSWWTQGILPSLGLWASYCHRCRHLALPPVRH